MVAELFFKSSKSELIETFVFICMLQSVICSLPAHTVEQYFKICN